MDISPGDSTPTSETSYSRTPTNLAAGVSEHHHHHHHHHHAHPSSSAPVAGGSGGGSGILLASPLPRLVSHPQQNSCGNQQSSASTPQRQGCYQPSKPPLTPTIAPTQQASPSSSSTPNNPTSSGQSMSLASLPRLLSQITGSKDQSELSPQKALQTIQTALMLSRQVSLEPGGSGGYDGGNNSTGNHQGSSMQASSQLQPLKVDTSSNHPTIGEGPPTPTHSESQDYQDARKGKGKPNINLSVLFLKNIAKYFQ